MGKVSLLGMEFYARHGYYDAERMIGNKYSVDVELELDFSEAAEKDTLDGTVNYETVYEIVAEIMATEALLLEHIVGKIIRKLRHTFHQVETCKVRVCKFNPPIKGLCQQAVVEMED